MLQIILFCNDWRLRQMDCINESAGEQFPTLGPSENQFTFYKVIIKTFLKM